MDGTNAFAARGASDTAIMWRLFRYGWRYRGRLATMTVSTLVMAALSGVLIFASHEVLTALDGKRSVVEVLTPDGRTQAISGDIALIDDGGVTIAPKRHRGEPPPKSITVPRGDGAVVTTREASPDEHVRDETGFRLRFTLPGTRTGDRIHRLMALGAWLAALAPIAALSAYIAWVTSQWLANRSMVDLRGDFVAHLVRLELAYHNSLAKGDLLTRMTSDLSSVQTLFQNLFGKVLQRPAEAAGTVVGLFCIDWRMASLVFLVLVPIGAVLSRLLRRVRHRSRRARERLAENVVALEQIASGIRVIKAMGSASAERSRYAGANEKLFAANMKLARSRGNTDAVTNGAIFAMMGGSLALMAVVLAHGWSDAATLLLFLAGFGRITALMRTGTKSYTEIQETMPAAERVFAVLDRSSLVVDKPGARECPAPARAIALDAVRFRYAPDAEEVLRGVDLEIRVGTTVALVGESGAGKSTILDLVPRLRDVTGGRILIDGVDVRDLTQDSLIRHFAIVSQDAFLFNDTVYENIRYGRPDATPAEIEQAARRAHVHDAILSLEGGLGYQTGVGDRGERLSGGQRQRVAIARALLRDAPVLLLDEPTSALDADSERHVQAALAELMQGRTSIVVAHRLATVQHADVICVLSRGAGTIVERGTHQELVARGGEYARLVSLQRLD